MKYIAILGVFIGIWLSSGLVNSLSAQENYQRLRLSAQSTEELETLAKLGIEADHCLYREGCCIEHEFAPLEIVLLQKAGIEYEVLYENASEFYDDLRKGQNQNGLKNGEKKVACDVTENHPIPENFTLGAMGGFFTYQEMLDHLDNMHQLYPELITEPQPIEAVDEPALPNGPFETIEGRPIYHTVITNSMVDNPEKKQILYTALHHAREPLSLGQMLFFMHHLLENYETDLTIKSLLDRYELHFVPCINPDGYLYNESLYEYNDAADFHTFGFWRKNMRDNNWDGVFDEDDDGVDLNRNYGYNWGHDDLGSSDTPSSFVYRGTEGFSEPETQAIKWLCEQNNYISALNYHSYGNLLLFPWGYETIQVPDSLEFCILSDVYTSENQYVANVPGSILYNVNGYSDDWMYGEQETKNKILAFSPEVGHESYGFYPPENIQLEIYKLTLAQNLYNLKSLGSVGYIEDKGSNSITSQTGFLNFELTQKGLTAGSFTIGFKGLSPAITSISTQTTNSLEIGETYSAFVPYIVDTSMIIYGEPLAIEISVNNGQYVETDTIYKIAQLGDNEVLLDTLHTFSTNSVFASSTWGLTTEEFHSPPSCLTDSPDNVYGNFAVRDMVLSDTIDLTNAEYAEMNFWAKWDLEDRFDYVQLIAVDLASQSKTSLCGLQTNINSSAGPGEPVYDGVQEEWVLEEVLLNDFLGSKIQLHYELRSDNHITRDGFYLDDLNFKIVASLDSMAMDEPIDTMPDNTIDTIPETNSVAFQSPDLLPNSRLVSLVPNPAKDFVNINYILDELSQLSQSNQVRLVVVNKTGQTIFQSTLDTQSNNLSIQTAEWAAGVYFLYIEKEGKRSNVEKLIVY